jgi:hypothetical protein
MKNLFLVIFLCYFLTQQAQTFDKTKQYTPVAIGFWNCENFYDTLNDPLKSDEEYLPTANNGWDSKKYYKKLDHISDVISQLATDATPDGVAIMGLCEIESKSVLEDIVKAPKLKTRGYKIVHVEGPDQRGVDVALLYNPKYFTVTSFHPYHLKLVVDSNHTTRDQLLVSGKLLGEEFHFIVCHWPSRFGGGLSEPNRIAAAKLGRKIIDSLLKVNANAKVILMGDLNDDPSDVSIRKYLNATGNEKEVKAPLLYNPLEVLFKKGIGTLAYNDMWNLFDQEIMTPALINGDYKGLHYHEAHIFNKPFVLTESGNFRGYPFRTFSGGSYTGGYSDHFSVYSILLKEK